jgi:hypothetical protein
LAGGDFRNHHDRCQHRHDIGPLFAEWIMRAKLVLMFPWAQTGRVHHFLLSGYRRSKRGWRMNPAGSEMDG